MPYTRTKQHILDFLKHKRSSGTPVEISEAMNKAGHNLNRKQVQKQLNRMKADGKVAVNEYGHYSLHEELQA
jgi:Fe2+ or Zn2+ uptake regulation protein